MSVLEGLKQAAETLRAADKIPEYNAILDAQQRIFDLQNEVQKLKEEAQTKKLVLEPGHNWMIDPEDPDHKLCPTCSQRHKIKQPLQGNVCRVCHEHFR